MIVAPPAPRIASPGLNRYAPVAVVIARDQVRIHFLDLLGDEAELRDAIGVELFLIKECDRF